MNKEITNRTYDCSRGCDVERSSDGELYINYNTGCCKLNSFDWMDGIPVSSQFNLFEVRFKNTRKGVYRNDSNQLLKNGDIVVVEAANGHDIGIVTLSGPIVLRQLARHKIDPGNYEFKKIYRKAKILDIERWQEALAREHKTMIRSRQLAARLGLNMKIGDVEFQGDGTKAIFYYIADERVDFRQLIKDFAEEFHIRIEMKQIGARQEAGLIGGIGVCGRTLCCSQYMSDFQSITTAAARCQDLSLNPQKLAGQCSKLKCCINYEASVYVDASKHIPEVKGPLEFQDGPAYLMKTDILGGKMYFSYDPHSLAKLFEVPVSRVKEILAENRSGVKSVSLEEVDRKEHEKAPEFVSAVGDDSISRFDEKKKKKRSNNHNGNHNGNHNRDNRNNNRHGGNGHNGGQPRKNEAGK